MTPPTGPLAPPPARDRRRDALVPLGLSALCLALAFVQRPGLITADTKINLHVDPVRFLGDVASMWTSAGQLGDVQAGQYAGYLFPMGPYYALGHLLGVADWVLARLWLAALMALAAWGMVRLLDAVLGRPRGVGCLVGGAVFILNPFVVTYANRTTVTLLAYAALPWLLLVVHRGVREPRAAGRVASWGWPAAFALLVTASGGGINAAVLAWMLVGPVLLALYEWWFAGAPGRDLSAFALRAALLTVATSLWWVIPAYVQSSYGIDFLHFTEQPGTVWGTTSVTESLRLMSFWLSYVGIGFAGRTIPFFDDSATYLFSGPVVVGTLLVPALALTGYVWARRHRLGPFFLALALVALVIMVAGFPDGTPLRHGLYFVYNRVSAVRFLRASYKAAPLLAVSLAGLAGMAGAEGWRRLHAGRARRWGPPLAGFGVVAVLGLAAWPMVTGRALDGQLSFRRVAGAWTRAATDLDRQLPGNARAIVLPGDLFSFYRWGGTVDPILPALSRRPVAQRTEVPYADLRATDLLWTIDALVHQQRLLPGQLAPLLSLIGVRAVVTGTDDDLARSDAPLPADVAAVLAAQPGFARPARSYGSNLEFVASGVQAPVHLPQVRRYDLPVARGLIRVEPARHVVVVDGSASGVAGLAAFGALPVESVLRYAADLGPAQLRDTLARGGELVVTDSNRRQAFVAGSLEQNAGAVLTPGQSVSADGLILDPFGGGADAQTVAAYTGVSDVSAPFSPQTRQFPEHRPFAALDGSPATTWLADPTLGPSGRWMQADFPAARAIAAVDLLPAPAADGVVRQVAIAGRTFAIHPGWNHLMLGLGPSRALRVTLTRVTAPNGGGPGAGGIAELRIPGLRATEALRLPVDATRATAGSGALAHAGLDYVFSRQTGDHPYARDPASSTRVSPPSAPPVPGDAELTMRRVFTVPAARRFTASAWVTASPQTPDHVLDRLAGTRGAVRATSSSRFDGTPGVRASMALDGDPATAWIGDWTPPARPWLAVVLPAPRRIRRLTIVAPGLLVRRPTLVQVSTPAGASRPLGVGPGGAVVLPRAIRTRRLQISILAATAPVLATPAQRRAVGIAELRGLGPAARVRGPRGGQLETGCATVAMQVSGVPVPMRVTGSVRAFNAGTPVPAVSCGAPFALAPGMAALAVAPGALAVDALRLHSPPPAPFAVGAAGVAGRLIAPGTVAHGAYNGVRVSIGGPSWLVLGESYDRGWLAYCNGVALGAPVPIDGYANGWRVAPGCRDVRFAFAPTRLARLGYAISAVAAVICLVVLVLGFGSRRRRVAPSAAPPLSQAPPPSAPSFARGLIGAVIAGAGFGFVFGLGAGVAAVPVTALILWRRSGARPLTLVAGGLLGVVVPLLYLLSAVSRRGGNHAGYPAAHLAAHWVGVAAVGLLLLALWRTLGRGYGEPTGAGTSLRRRLSLKRRTGRSTA